MACSKRCCDPGSALGGDLAMQVLPVVKRLPPALSKEIGRVIHRYALVESNYKALVYSMLGIGPKLGRIGARETRGKEYPEMIYDIAEIRGLEPNKRWFDDLRNKTEYIASRRDTLAHGIWVRDREQKKLLLRVTRGSWLPDPRKGKKKRKIIPEGIPFGPKECRVLLADINEVLKLQREIYRAIGATMRASPDKSGQRPRATSRPHHRAEVLRSPPQSSPVSQ